MTHQTPAVAYIRVSTEEQALEGVSLDAQEQTLRAYCTMRQLALVDLVREAGVSGGVPLAQRPGGQRVLELVRKRKVQAVVAWKLERLFRDCADGLQVVGQWDKAGVALHLVDLGGQAVDTKTAMGRFFLTVMAGSAELERNQIRERTAAAMRHKARLGEYTGGAVPYGSRLGPDGVQLAPIDDEQAVIGEAQALRQEGLSLRAIARTLEQRGRAPRQGQTWHPEQVKRLVGRGMASQTL